MVTKTMTRPGPVKGQGMKTQDAAARFYKNSEERGISPNTIRQYNAYLRHLIREYPELPLKTKEINDFLRKRGETPAHRGSCFKRLQAFYSYLEREEGIPSPVPPKGPMGRPRKFHKPKLSKSYDKSEPENSSFSTSATQKVVKGGQVFSDLSSTSISTTEAIAAFVKSRRARSKPLSPKTFKQYNWIFSRFLMAFPDQLPLTPEPIEAFLTEIKGSDSTRWDFKKTLKALYHFLVKRKGLPDAMLDIKLGKPPDEPRDKLTIDQIKQLFALKLSFHDRALQMLIFDIGCRAGEICNLTQEAVIAPGFVLLTGKTGKKVPTPIRQETFDALKMLSASGPVFSSSKGPLREQQLYRVVRGWLAQIGVTKGKRGPHMLRHSFAPFYLLQGGTLQDLSQVLGHKNLSTTAIYSEMIKDQLKEMHDKASPLNELLNGKENEQPLR